MTQTVTLLSFDFVKLIAVVVVIPIAGWATHNWHQNFAYHTNLSGWIFLLSGIIMITAAVAILCIRAGRAANGEPGKEFEEALQVLP